MPQNPTLRQRKPTTPAQRNRRPCSDNSDSPQNTPSPTGTVARAHPRTAARCSTTGFGMEQARVPALAPLKWWERHGVIFLLAACVAFGVLVEIRSVFLTRRMGDFGCYARGAWAVRTGADLYDVTCDNDWHYNYPPLLAILMVPLADPPRGEDTAGMTPYSVSVALWYLFSVLCLIVAVHALARALEEKSPDEDLRQQPRGCRRWWALRFWPILICIAPIGATLMRGQVNTFVLALLCGLLAGLIRGANFRA